MLRDFLSNTYTWMHWFSLAFFFIPSLVLSEELCKYKIKLPENFTLSSRQAGLFIGERKHKDSLLRSAWLLTCHDNVRRTSQTSEILKLARTKGEIIHEFWKMKVSQDIDSVLFIRTRVAKGKRKKAVEAYFATRNFEYHFYIFPIQGIERLGDKATYELLRVEMETFLKEGKFAATVERTITEEAYRNRLYVFIGSISFCFVLGIIGLALWFWKRKPKRSH